MKALKVFVFLISIFLNLYSDDLNWKNTERILDLEIFPWTQNILGRATGAYLCLNSTDTIVLDLVSLTVDSVIADGLIAGFYRAGDTLDTVLIISLGTQQWPGDTVHIDVFYHGTPLLIPGPLWAGGLRINAGLIFSIHAPFGLKAWVPCLDNHRHKAWVKQNITVPSDFFVMSNGRLDSAVNLTGNRKKFFWSETRRLIPYIQGIAASNYTLSNFNIDTFPVMIATYPQDSARAAFALRRLDTMYYLFSEKFGDYPFCKIAYAEVELSGGMQNQGCILVGPDQFDGSPASEILLGHEFAHMWWGDYVSPLDYGEVWFPEGWATFCEGLLKEQFEGTFSMHNYMKGVRNRYLSFENNYGYHQTHDPPSQHFYSELTYERPGTMLYALRFSLGDSVFFQASKDIFTIYGDSSVQWQDVGAVFSNSAGRDMTWFFDQWLNGTGTPELFYEKYVGRTNKDSSMVLSWTESPTATGFRVELPVHFFQNGAVQEILNATSEPDTERTSFFVPCDSYLVDPLNTQFVRRITRVCLELIAAVPQDQSVILTWQATPLPGLTGYNVYMAQYPPDSYVKVNQSLLADTFFVIGSLLNGSKYIFYVTHVADGCWESYPSDTAEATPVSFPFDRNLLIVDESKGGSGASTIMPTDWQFDSAYDAIFEGYDYDVFHCDDSLPPLSLLGHYRQVFWHSDEYTSTSEIIKNPVIVQSYVSAGGKMTISGWRVFEGIESGFLDYLGLQSAVLVTEKVFEYADGVGNNGTFPDVHINSDLMLPSWNGKMDRCMYLVPAGNQETLAVWGQGSSYQGRITTLKVYDNLVLNTYPLYFVQNADARNFIAAVVGVEEEIKVKTENLLLAVLYEGANRVKFVLPANCRGNVEVRIYDVSGREVFEDEFSASVPYYLYEWRSSRGEILPGGSYFITFNSPDFKDTRKILKIE